MTDPAELAKLAERLNRSATCLEAWAKGIGPYPDTVQGVSAVTAERVRKAAAMLDQLAITERARSYLDKLPVPDMDKLLSDLARYNIAVTRGGERIDPEEYFASTMSAEEVREAALSLIESERLTDETGEPDDVAYNRAINDCLEAIRAMPLTK